LEAIHTRKALQWPSKVAAFDTRLSEIERRMLEFPLGAPEVAERPGIRVIFFGEFPFRLFYSVTEDTVEVLAIRHASRRPLFE
jgi:plasmid stabilization system protein ParE